MEFKTGDKVRVNKNLLAGISTDSNTFNNHLKEGIYKDQKFRSTGVSIIEINGKLISIFTQALEKVDDFVLPEKWYILITRDNINDINKVRQQYGSYKKLLNYNEYEYLISEGDSYKLYGDNYIMRYCNMGYEEITSEQFRKYVLKEEKEPEVKPKVSNTSDKVIRNSEIDLIKKLSELCKQHQLEITFNDTNDIEIITKNKEKCFKVSELAKIQDFINSNKNI